MNLTKQELETLINYNEEEKTAIVETANKALISRLDKMCSISSDIICVRKNENFSIYHCPKRWVKIRMPRQYTEEEREKRAIRARENLLGKNHNTREVADEGII